VNSAWHYHSHHELRPALPCVGGGNAEHALSQSSFGRQRFDVEAPRTADIGPRGPVLRYSNHFLVRRSRVGPSGTLQIGKKIEPGAADHAHRHNRYTNRLWGETAQQVSNRAGTFLPAQEFGGFVPQAQFHPSPKDLAASKGVNDENE
jgi:hypothetical protein